MAGDASHVLLQIFAQVGLKPDEKQLAEGKSFAQMVFELLKKKKKGSYPSARVIIGGSVGKSTAIKQIFDFDCVILINPPFNKKEVLDEWEDLLLCSERSDIKSVKLTQHSIQFKCSSTEFEYDLLPATNFVTEPNLSGAEVIKRQRERTLEEIRKNPSKAYEYSSSLVESQVEFMKNQSAYVHELVRLCKFWNKTIYINEYVSGRSTIIELIAVHVGKRLEVEARHTTSGSLILPGFKAFLAALQNLSSLRIIFDGAEPAVPMNPPILLEPANPYNNILSNMDSKVINKLANYAKETLRRLTFFKSLADLFEAQPKKNDSFQFGREPNFFVDGGEGVKKKTMVILNKRLEADGVRIAQLKSLVETYVLTNILASTNGAPGSMAPGSKDFLDFLDSVRKAAFQAFCKMMYGEERPGGGGLKESADIEFTIPYEKHGRSYWITLGISRIY